MSTNSVIEAKALGKTFTIDLTGRGVKGALKALFNRKKRTVHAIENVAFSIGRGEFVGYVGENGAGKSTTIKILTGILVPTAGEVRVNGVIPYLNRRVNAMQIGVVFGQRTQLWWDLPVRESYEMLKSIYQVKEEEYRHNLKKLTSALDLGELMDVPVRKLSLGQRMRCDLAASLIHRPPVLFLDEPTIGLDVLAKDSIRSFLKDTNKREGTTIILTTHDMNDIEHLCERLIMLDKGRIIYDGLTQALKEKFLHEKRIEVEFDSPVNQLKDLPELEITAEKGNKKWFRFEGGERSIADIIGKLVHLYPVKDLSVGAPTVEHVIKSIYANRALLTEPTEEGREASPTSSVLTP